MSKVVPISSYEEDIMKFSNLDPEIKEKIFMMYRNVKYLREKNYDVSRARYKRFNSQKS